jgi:osmotically inducible protein OsmC
MALAMMIGEAGFTAKAIETTAAVTLDKLASGYAVTASHLTVRVVIAGVERGRIEEIAATAKSDCPVSKLLNAAITMEVKVEIEP